MADAYIHNVTVHVFTFIKIASIYVCIYIYTI